MAKKITFVEMGVVNCGFKPKTIELVIVTSPPLSVQH
jgi:hypothetical protein